MGNNIVTYEVDNRVISEDKMAQLKFVRVGQFNHLGEMELYALQDHYFLSKCYANEISDEDGEYRLMHRDRMLISHPNLIQYFGYSIKNNHSLLRNLTETRWFFEYVHVSLRDVVINHRNYLSNVHEKEIWRLLQQCVSVNAYLESKVMCHSELQTDQIYLDKDQNVKIIEKGLLRLQSGYARALVNENYTLMSPLLVQQFNQQIITPTHDINKSDVFSLGMTFLELMTLKDSAQCYLQGEQLTIDQNLITQRLQESQLVYSETLVNLISNMLIWDEDKRPYFRDILVIYYYYCSYQPTQITMIASRSLFHNPNLFHESNNLTSLLQLLLLHRKQQFPEYNRIRLFQQLNRHHNHKQLQLLLNKLYCLSPQNASFHREYSCHLNKQLLKQINNNLHSNLKFNIHLNNYY